MLVKWLACHNGLGTWIPNTDELLDDTEICEEALFILLVPCQRSV